MSRAPSFFAVALFLAPNLAVAQVPAGYAYPYFYPTYYVPTFHPSYVWTSYPFTNGISYYGWYPATAVLYHGGGQPAYYSYYPTPYYPAASAAPVAPARGSSDTLAVAERLERAPSGANEAAAAMLFWRGYDKYFDRDYVAARDLFRESLAKFDGDARPWYFRGLCELALGNRGAADRSLRRGAQAQHQGQPGPEALSQVLERIQGPQRAAIMAAQRQAAR